MRLAILRRLLWGLGFRQLPAAPAEADPPKEKKQPKLWAYDGLRACEYTKSEARARFKTARGLDRLPVGAKVERVA